MKIEINSSYEVKETKNKIEVIDIEEERFLDYVKDCSIESEEDLEDLLYDFLFDECYDIAYVTDPACIEVLDTRIGNIEKLTKHFSDLIKKKPVIECCKCCGKPL